jgi:hypothetical protein
MCSRMGNRRIAATLLGSTAIPSLDTMWPKSLPQGTKNLDLAALMDMPYSLHCSKHFLKHSACF